MNIRKLRRYLYPRLSRYRLPMTLVDDYNMASATKDQKIIMLAGYARSPKEAQRLMTRYKATTAHELMRHMKPRRTRPRIITQLANLIMRIEGARRGMAQPPKPQSQVWVNYDYRKGE